MILRLIAFALMPIVTTVVILLIENKTAHKKLNYWQRQIIIGVIFGMIACLATIFSVQIEKADMNLRNAAPLTAGLVFGAPAALISGVMGAIFRYISIFFGSTQYTVVACTISTLLAGVVGAAGYRMFMTKSRRMSWVCGTVITVINEVIHMLLIFFTNAQDPMQAFLLIEECTIPMILGTSLSVATSIAISMIILHGNKKSNNEKKSVSDTFQMGLVVCIMIGLMYSGTLTYIFYDTIETEWAYGYMELAEERLGDRVSEINKRTISQYLVFCAELSEEYPIKKCMEEFSKEMILDGGEESLVYPNMFVTDAKGKCIDTSNPDFVEVGQSIDSRFLDIFEFPEAETYDDVNIHISEYNEQKQVQYGGMRLENGNILFAAFGQDSTRLFDTTLISTFAETQLIGETGYVLLISDGKIVADGRGIEGSGSSNDYMTVQESGFKGTIEELPIGKFFEHDMFGDESFCLRVQYTGTFGVFDALFVHPIAEVVQARNAAVYAIVLNQILIFSLIFVITHLISNRVVINKIDRVNDSLNKIAAGDLRENVNVREYKEFDSLSNDINATVDTLKSYIDEANTRIDKDLAFAKEIQEAALPAIFPPYPNRRDFDIYASMDAAKTVGGDFYDLYLADKDHLVFLVADVSGKSIPGAMFMMRSKTIIKNMVEKGLSVEQAFTEANSYLVDGNRAKMFVTCWMGIADLRTGILSFANAGHNQPLIRHKNGQFEYIRTKTNFVLAGKKNIKYQKNEIQLLPGDEIFLYTDGVTEALDINDVMFGEERLIQALNETPNETVEQRCRRIKQKLDEFAGEAEQFDDITMLSVSFNSFTSDDRIISDSEPESAEMVSKFICDKIKRDDVKQTYARKLQIIVDEIYSNIIRYSGAKMAEIYCNVSDNELKLVFKDDGEKYDPLAGPDPNVKLSAKERKIGGLGIFMVKKLASSLNYRYEDGYNVLTVRISLAMENDAGQNQ